MKKLLVHEMFSGNRYLLLLYRLSYEAKRAQAVDDYSSNCDNVSWPSQITKSVVVEQWLIKSGGRGFDSPRGRCFFPYLMRSPISLLGLTLNGKKILGSL